MAERCDYLLIGGGLAGATAAERLRALDGEGSILLVGREVDPPYHRPPCSKGLLEGKEEEESAYIHPPEWYGEQGIELLRRTTVVGLDGAAKEATLADGGKVSFRKALLATGANVRRLAVEGSGLEGIHYLRTLPNARAIREEAHGAEQVVLVGGSFIGCEVAASLHAVGKEVALLMLEEFPFERSFGRRAATRFRALLEDAGIPCYGQEEVAAFRGGARVEEVESANGRRLASQLVVIGAGVAPELRLARTAGLALGELGGVRTNDRLQTSHPDIYAAGDICEYPSALHGRHLRLEHWDVAYNQGAVAAENMAGRETPYAVLPYFFSDLSDFAALEYVGPAYQWEEELERYLEPNRFTVHYLAGGRLVATLAVGEPEAIPLGRLLIERQLEVDRTLARRLADPAVAPEELRAELEGSVRKASL